MKLLNSLIILLLMVTNVYAGYTVSSGDLLVTSGSVGVGSSSPRAKLDVDGSVYATAFFGNGQYLTGISTSESDPKVGTLAANKVPKWGTTTLVDSIIYDNGTNVGINSTSPTEKLNVAGNILASGTVTGSNLSGSNTGDNATNTQYSSLVSNATHTGEVTGSTALTIADGVTVANWVLQTPNIGVSTATTINKVTITAPASSATLTIADGKTLTATSTVNLNTMTDGKFCTYTASGTVINCTSDAGSLSGLNAGYISRASSATAIVDSGIYQNGTNIGIGTTVPLGKLQIVGTGNVGIGTTVTPQLLTIAGRANFVSIGTTTAGTLSCFKADGTLGWCSGSVTGNACATCN